MSRYLVESDQDGEYIMFEGRKFYLEPDSSPTGLSWADVDDSGLPVKDEHGYVMAWDNVLFSQFSGDAKKMHSDRSSCVTPRGVLKKIYKVVCDTLDGVGGIQLDDVVEVEDGDFPWFKQRGNVYSDRSKSTFSRYANLHLGLAYEKITPEDYYFKVGKDDDAAASQPTSDQYKKPSSLSIDGKTRMIKRGWEALYDAFCVLRNEHVFNIYNSDANVNPIELFNPANANSYSQSQCAIVIERVFSRLYKYLQFKSTITEKIPRHINIDSGYKYLTAETICNSDNEKGRDPYYNDGEDGDKVSYLRYLSKLGQYLKNHESDNFFTPSERTVLGHFITIISRKELEATRLKWDLCPLCSQHGTTLKYQTPRSVVMRAGEEDGEEGDGQLLQEREIPRSVIVDFCRRPWMEWSHSDYATESQTSTLGDFEIDLSPISEEVQSNPPTYTNLGRTVEYTLLGYSTVRGSSDVQFTVDGKVTADDIADGNVLNLYAVWTSPVIVQFLPGAAGNQSSTMSPVVVEQNSTYTLGECTYKYSGGESKVFTYHDNPKWSNNVGELNLESPIVNNHAFSSWLYDVNGRTISVADKSPIIINLGQGVEPLISLVAQWEWAYASIPFNVDGDRYCDVLVKISDRMVVYPSENPVLSEDGRSFIGWDKAEGSEIPSIQIQNVPMVCSFQDQWVVCDNDGFVVRQHSKVVTDFAVSAQIAEDLSGEMTVTFKYMHGRYGGIKWFSEVVHEGQYLPTFHIHQDPFVDPTDSNYEYVFRYWKLESGNMAAGMLVMSDCVFVAVYDRVKKVDLSDQMPVLKRFDVESDDSDTRTDGQPLQCQFISGEDDLDPDGRRYCKFPGINPVSTSTPREKDGYPFRSDIECPYIKLLRQINGIEDNQDFEDKENDFEVMTLLQIDDISNLLKALFKVNIDIAHREYYLKVDIPERSDWWYGYVLLEMPGHKLQIVCDAEAQNILCDGSTDNIVCSDDVMPKWVSFEPTVEYKFSNFHALNHVVNGKIPCTVQGRNAEDDPGVLWITPVNRELLNDAEGRGMRHNDLWYYYDYAIGLDDVFKVKADENGLQSVLPYSKLDEAQRHYSIQPLHMYERTDVQSPVDVNGHVRHRCEGVIPRSPTSQLKTFTSIVKKYRPIIMPDVRYIFNDCVNNKTKYEVDRDNDYGVFGWCTIPSKTMVNMQYNEESIIVPSSYDHHNRIGGRNFLQMDKDFEGIYRQWSSEQNEVVSNLKDSWYYLYDTRDWTYFLKPFFQINANNDVYTWQIETFGENYMPKSSDHLNGVIFEPTTLGREQDRSFGDIAATCKFLAKYHHGEKNLKTLAEAYTKLIPYSKLLELTRNGDEFNSMYGSQCNDIPSGFKFPDEDWIDDYDKTGSYVDGDYSYNLGQAHAIDDFDEDSVWFYITMTRPVDDMPQVLEIEDIMPFVFWWQNRGEQNNGPSVNCYGRASNAKLNYQLGGWCYSSAQSKVDIQYARNRNGTYSQKKVCPWEEQKWHAVQHTMGVDFSTEKAGGTILTTDNSGNVYKGAFDPNCAGTDEKWKIHDNSNAFGVVQQEDPKEDKYFKGEEAHGDGEFSRKSIPDEMNTDVLKSMSGNQRQMVWNLWNVVRHYAYIRYFKNKDRELGDDKANWEELERMTRKLVKGVYRTFKEKQQKSDRQRATFGAVDSASNKQGSPCVVRWTNSFIEVQSILDRNAREHDASLVLFTGDMRPDGLTAIQGYTLEMTKYKHMYDTIQ